MSRRLSKKSRGKALTSALALSAANLPKPELHRLDGLFARSHARKLNVRTSLLVGTALSAGILASTIVGTTLISVGPAMARNDCTTAGTNNFGPGNFITGIECDGVTSSTTINVTGPALIGPDNFHNGIGLTAGAAGLTLGVTTDSKTVIGVGSNYSISHDGIHVFSDFSYAGTTIDITNAAAIGIGNATGSGAQVVGRDGIHAKIDVGNETSAELISIGNSNTIYSGRHGIYAAIIAGVPDTIAVTNTITITNTANIGSPNTYVGGDGIFSLIEKTGFAPSGGSGSASITGKDYHTNSMNIWSTGDAQYAHVPIIDTPKGGAYAYVSMSNSGNLTSKLGDGLHGNSTATSYGGQAKASVLITNTTGTLIAKTTGYGIRGYSKADAHYSHNAGNATTTGGNATATVSISSSGNISTGNASQANGGGNEGILGLAKAFADGHNYGSGNLTKANGGNANASVTISNTAPKITVNGNQSAIDGNATASAEGQATSGENGSGKGGNATATTNIYSSGALAVHYTGNSTSKNATVSGYAGADANAYGGTYKFGSAIGGNASANTTITNKATITSPNNSGIFGYSRATANAGSFPDGLAYTAQGGSASAVTIISNNQAIKTYGDGIYGKSFETAQAWGNHSAHGGVAPAIVSISNAGPITSTHGYGQKGYAYAAAGALAYNATGGTATSQASLTNSFAITSYHSNLFAAATSLTDALGGSGPLGTAQGGTSSATVLITNTGPLSQNPANVASGAFGIYGDLFASASGGFLVLGTGGGNPGQQINGNSLFPLTFFPSYTAAGGTATAMTSITNAGAMTIKSPFANAIYGGSRAFADANAQMKYSGATATGGTATATTTISNTGSLYNAHHGTIDGYSRADTNAYGYHATGGNSTAMTTIYNSNSLLSAKGTAIYGGAHANANAFGSSKYAHGFGQGGTATATVQITSVGSGNIMVGSGGGYNNGIVGRASASAQGHGYSATGGVATASTTISNIVNIYSFEASGIIGTANADASGFANYKGIGGVGTGGTAVATTSITNGGYITSATWPGSGHNGIYGYSRAGAIGVGWHGYGGTAYAKTTITNSGAVQGDAAINGIAKAYAGGYGSSSVEPGKGVGGTATAIVVINNAATGTLGAPGNIVGWGIYGMSRAQAHGEGIFGTYATQAVGGTATANTLISNAANIYSYRYGIFGKAIAEASAHGSYGIAGSAQGGVATAYTSITSSGNIVTYGNHSAGISGFAGAFADGHGLGGIGGTATATTTIMSSSNIVTIGNYSPGIYGGSLAKADGTTTGGTATATTTLVNTMLIKTYGYSSPGMLATAAAYADPPAAFSSGGNATANASATNNGTIITYRSNSPGMEAFASANTVAAKDGNAVAMASATNNGSIVTAAFGWPSNGGNASGNTSGSSLVTGNTSGNITGNITGNQTIIIDVNGNISGNVTIGNLTVIQNVASNNTFNYNYSGGNGSGNSSGNSSSSSGSRLDGGNGSFGNASNCQDNGSPGMCIGSRANDEGDALAIATSTAVNSETGSILTTGPHSPGIYAFSLAFTGGVGPSTAVATTTVTNAGSIITTDWRSPGIVALSYAYGYSLGATATATTTVYNTSGAVIKTYEGHSDGIFAFAGAGTDAAAATNVTNDGVIITHDHWSAGIYAGSYAFGGGTSATATTKVYQWDYVRTYGSHSPGVVAYAGAFSAANSATAHVYVENDGATITSGRHSPGIAAYAFTGTSRDASAQIVINNFDLIKTTGKHSDAIYASVVSLSASNNNYIHIFNDEGSIIADGGWHQFGFHAIAAYGAPTTIWNTGSTNDPGYIHGNIQLGAFNNTFFNETNGIWRMRGNSNFGGAFSNVDNAGIVSFDASGSASVRSPDFATAFQRQNVITLAGLYQFNNSGLITMVNGSANDRMVITGPTPFGNVNFTGYGNSTLHVDAFLSAPFISSADVLQIGSKSVAKGYVTGLTHIIVNDVAPGLPGAYNPIGIPVVESNGDVTPGSGSSIGTNVKGNFDLPQGPIEKGFFAYNLFYLPKTDASACQSGFNCWFLASTPGTGALEFTQLDTAAVDIWSDAAGLWLDRTADLRDYFFNPQSSCDARGGGADLAVKAPPCVPSPSGVGPGAWVRAYGDWIRNNSNATWTAFGTTLTSDVHYNQTNAGAQLGYDWAFMRTSYSSLLVGVMGGADELTVNFASGTKVTFQGGNAGAYATFLSRGWFADGLFLANWMSMDYTGSGTLFGGLGGLGNIGVNTDMSQYGGRIDTGYRFQFNPWFFEPQFTAEVVHTSFGDLPFPIFGTNVSVDDDTSVRGRIGGRIGTTWVTNGWRIEPSVDGGVWQTFAGSNGAVLTNNGFAIDLTDPNNNKTEGEVGGMLNFYQIGTSWSAFVKGDYRFANDYTSGSVKGGVRYQWP